MHDSRDIRYIAHANLDMNKWDACINHAENGLIYAYSFYLDKMTDSWDGLVLDEYKAVMPVTHKKKYGIAYLAQPFLCAQLGLFGSGIEKGLMEDFLAAIPKKFRYLDIYLNYRNNFPIPGLGLYTRNNYVLDLGKTYHELSSAYRENTLRNIKKSTEAGCTLKKNIDAEELILLAKAQLYHKDRDTEENISRFRNLYAYLSGENMAEIYGVMNRDKKLVSAAAFFYSTGRAYYILVGNDPESRDLGASHALIDHFIREKAGKQVLLDFEGSDIESLAFFYSGFGARVEKYTGLKQNLLPFYLKWIKK
jgi:hypothetical protein